MKKIISILFLFIIFQGFTQQKELSINDAVLGYYKGLYPATLNGLQFVDGTSNFIYNDYNSGEIIFNNTSDEIQKSIAVPDFQKVYPDLKRLPRILSIDASEMIFRNNSKFEVYNYVTNQKSASISIDENAQNTEFNKKANAVAYTIDNNLFIATSANPSIKITDNSDENIVSGQTIHRSEFGIYKGTFWSPNGNLLAFYQKDESTVTDYPLVDVTTTPATVINTKYPMAGQGSEKASIGIYNLKSNKTTFLDIDTSDEHYLTNLVWTPDEKYVLVAEINRDQNHVWYNRYDIVSGKKVNTLFEETNDTWTEPEHDAVFLPNSNTEFLWFSERDGFMNLYHYNTNGKLYKQVTKFNWVVKSILGFDEKGKHVFITGTGNDPRENHTFKVNLKSGKSTQLTTQKGSHSTYLSSNGNYLIDSYSSLDTPNEVAIINTNKRTSTSIHSATNPLSEYNLGTTEFVTLKANDGTDLYGRISKPANFDSSQKYPVLIYVYGGPHAQLVTNRWLGGASLWMPAFATLENYIVFTLDNRGSASRGFAFENAIHRNLGDLEIEDQLKGVDYLKSLNFIDADRIAVHGWSYGGFMATSMMLRNPDMFTTAVAGGPVTDWKYYEIMYGERYMDTPEQNPEGYKKSRVHNYIKDLQGKLLLIHGSVDPVVVPQHSLSLLQEAVKNKVQIDFFTYPMHEHNVRGTDRAHLMTKVLDYIVENNTK